MTEKNRGPHPLDCSDTSSEGSYHGKELDNKYAEIMAIVEAPASAQKKLSLFRSPNSRRRSTSRKSVGFPRSVVERAFEESPPQPAENAAEENTAENDVAEQNHTPEVVVEEKTIENHTGKQSAVPHTSKNKKKLVCSTPLVAAGRIQGKTLVGGFGGGRLSTFMELSSIGSGSSKSNRGSNGGHVESDQNDRNRDADNKDENPGEGELEKTKSRGKNQPGNNPAKGKSIMTKTPANVAPSTSKSSSSKAAVRVSPRKKQQDVSLARIVTISDDHVLDDEENQGASPHVEKPPAVIARRRNALHCLTPEEEEDLQRMQRNLTIKFPLRDQSPEDSPPLKRKASSARKAPARTTTSQVVSPIMKKRKSINDLVDRIITEKVNREIQTSPLTEAVVAAAAPVLPNPGAAPPDSAPSASTASGGTTIGNKRDEVETGGSNEAVVVPVAVAGASSQLSPSNEPAAASRKRPRPLVPDEIIAGPSTSHKYLRKRSRNWVSNRPSTKPKKNRWAALKDELTIDMMDYMMNRERGKHDDDDDDEDQQSDKISDATYSDVFSGISSESDLLHRQIDEIQTRADRDYDNLDIDAIFMSTSSKRAETSRWRMMTDSGGGGGGDGINNLGGGPGRNRRSSPHLGHDDFLMTDPAFLVDSKKPATRQNVRKTFFNRKKLIAAKPTVVSTKRRSSIANATSVNKNKKKKKKRISQKLVKRASSRRPRRHQLVDETSSSSEESSEEDEDETSPRQAEVQTAADNMTGPRLFELTDEGQRRLEQFDRSRSPFLADNQFLGSAPSSRKQSKMNATRTNIDLTSNEEDVEDAAIPSTSREIVASPPRTTNSGKPVASLNQSDKVKEQTRRKHSDDVRKKLLSSSVSKKTQKKKTHTSTDRDLAQKSPQPSTSRGIVNSRRNMTIHSDSDSDEVDRLQIEARKKQLEEALRTSPSPVLQKSPAKQVANENRSSPYRRIQSPRRNLTVEFENADAGEAREQPGKKQPKMQSPVLNKTSRKIPSTTDEELESVRETTTSVDVNKSPAKQGSNEESSSPCRRNLTNQDAGLCVAPVPQEPPKKVQQKGQQKKVHSPVVNKTSNKVTSTDVELEPVREAATTADVTEEPSARESQEQPKNKQKPAHKKLPSPVLNRTSSRIPSTTADAELEPIQEAPTNDDVTEEPSTSTARNVSTKNKRKDQKEKSDLSSRNVPAKKQTPAKKQKINVEENGEKDDSEKENSKKNTKKMKKPAAPKAKKNTNDRGRVVKAPKPTANVIEDNHEEDTGLRRSGRERKPRAKDLFLGHFIVRSERQFNQLNRLRNIYTNVRSNNNTSISRKTSMLKRTASKALSPIQEDEPASPAKIRHVNAAKAKSSAAGKKTATTDKDTSAQQQQQQQQQQHQQHQQQQTRNAQIVQSSDVSGIEPIIDHSYGEGPSASSASSSCIAAQQRVTRSNKDSRNDQFLKVSASTATAIKRTVAATPQKKTTTGRGRNNRDQGVSENNTTSDVSMSSSTRSIDKKVLSVNRGDKTYSVNWVCDSNKKTDIMKVRKPIAVTVTTSNELEGSSSGLLKIAPKEEKPKQFSNEYSVYFRVVNGKGLVQLDALNESRNSTVVKQEDFTIPKGASYYIKNLNKTVPLLLSYVKFRPAQE